jgi:hypothetical protein
MLTRDHEILRLSFVQTFSIEKPLLGGYKVKTRSYFYAVEDENSAEIIAFHWHPETPDTVPFPHLHICHGAGSKIRPDVRNVHFRTDRIAFEDFALMLIRDGEEQNVALPDTRDRGQWVDHLRGHALTIAHVPSFRGTHFGSRIQS